MLPDGLASALVLQFAVLVVAAAPIMAGFTKPDTAAVAGAVSVRVTPLDLNALAPSEFADWDAAE